MIKNMSIILSEHFNLTEFTTSLVAATRRIDNTPPLSAVGNLQQLCLHVLEPLRAHLGHAVRINSGYRSPRLNAAVGGVKTSDHARLRRRHLCPRRQDRPRVVRLDDGQPPV